TTKHRSCLEIRANDTRPDGDGRSAPGTCTTSPERAGTTSRFNTSIAWFSIDGIGDGRRHCARLNEPGDWPSRTGSCRVSEVTSGKLCRKCGIRVDPDGLCYWRDAQVRLT